MLKPDFTKYDNNSGAHTIFNVKEPIYLSDYECKDNQDMINVDDMLSFIELFMVETDKFEKKDSTTIVSDGVNSNFEYLDKVRFDTYNYNDMYIYNIIIIRVDDDGDDDSVEDTVLVLERNGKYVYGGSEGAHACFGNNNVSYSHSHGENDFIEEKMEYALESLYGWIDYWAVNG